MQRIAAIALGLGTMVAATSAAAQSNGASLNFKPFAAAEGEAPLALKGRGLEFPISQYVDERGAVQQRRGIVVGKQVAPDTMLGFGMFDRMPKTRSFTPQLDPPASSQRRAKTRGAAIGLRLRF